MDRAIRSDLTEIWKSGIDAVRGETAVRKALAEDDAFEPDLVVAVGKAASSMCIGALSALSGSPPTIIVMPRGGATAEVHADNLTVYESSHPVPDESSIAAGQAVWDAVTSLNENASLLLLVSGGASALVELLEEGVTLQTLRQDTAAWIGGGLSIAEINAHRISRSRIKGGKLLHGFRGKEVRSYAISDVEGDDIAIIGSGIGDVGMTSCAAEARVIACNRDARDAAANVAAGLGYNVRHNEESLYGDVNTVASQIVNLLSVAESGVYIWGGEPTVDLPPRPGVGGRNQSLALAVALGLRGHEDIAVLAGGTDGIDGSSDAAGGCVSTDSINDEQDALRYLRNADAGTWLALHDALVVTGPTDTNVMDLVVAIVGAGGRA